MSTRNLALMIREQARKYSDKRNILYYNENNEWKGISWKEFGELVDIAAKGLLELGVEENELVGVYSSNKPEWTICDYAIMSIKGITVSVHAPNTSPQTEYIVNDSKMRIMFVDGQFQYDNVMRFFNGSNTLTTVIVFDKSVSIDRSKNIMYIDELYELGKKSNKDDVLQQRLASATSDDIAAIMYTSGTTGDPKGAMLAHDSFFVEFDALEGYFPLEEGSIDLVFCPLSHVVEKSSLYWGHFKGSTQYFCSDTNKIVEYFQEIRPTYMVGVPRLYEKMYATVWANLEKASSFKRKLFEWAIETGKKYRYAEFRNQPISLSLKIQHAIAYKTVLQKIRSLLGGRLSFLTVGGAPLAKEIEEFFFAANIFIAQGYGLTETAPLGTYNWMKDFKFGTVGKPAPCNQIKLAPDGEILIKGPNVMKGYYGKPEATKEAMTEDGWFKTGDVGVFDEDGFLHITDRKKDIIVTAGGKNVAPQQIEARIGQDYYIEQIVCIGDRRKFISALIVPSFPAIEVYAKDKGIPFKSNDDLIKHPAIIELISTRVEKHTQDLANHEKIKKFTLLPEPLTVEKNEITFTMKPKRKVIMENYKEIIENMYKD